MTAGLSRRSAWASPVRDGPVSDSSRLHPVAHRIEIAKTRVMKSTGLKRSGRLIPASCVDWGVFHVRVERCEGTIPLGSGARRMMKSSAHYTTKQLAEGVGFEV